VLAALPLTVHLLTAPGVRIELPGGDPEVVFMPGEDGYATNVLELRFEPMPEAWVAGICVADATGRILCCQPAVEPGQVQAGDSLVIPPGGLVTRPAHWA
jgi:hypothetical protein